MLLDGIRVIDFSQYIPGPFASLRLAELGAEVINVEPLTGDPARGFKQQPAGSGSVYTANNYNKKSITINLKSEKGQKLAGDLIKKSDVVIESFRPGVMKRFGLDYENLKEINKNIIYCSLTGYGQEGNMSSLGSHDINYLSVSGILAQFKDSNKRPVIPNITLADLIGGIAASESILSALYQREISGKGMYIDFSIRDTVLSLMNTHLDIEQNTGEVNGVALLTGEIVSYNIYQTKDNRYISLAALEPKFWANFCEATGCQEWIEAQYSKAEEENVIYREIKELFKSKTFREWAEFGLAVDSCLTPVFEVNELYSNPYLDNKEVYNNKNSSPVLGEHTNDILKKILKKNEEEISLLRAENVI